MLQMERKCRTQGGLFRHVLSCGDTGNSVQPGHLGLLQEVTALVHGRLRDHPVLAAQNSEPCGAGSAHRSSVLRALTVHSWHLMPLASVDSSVAQMSKPGVELLTL